MARNPRETPNETPTTPKTDSGEKPWGVTQDLIFRGKNSAGFLGDFPGNSSLPFFLRGNICNTPRKTQPDPIILHPGAEL